VSGPAHEDCAPAIARRLLIDAGCYWPRPWMATAIESAYRLGRSAADTALLEIARRYAAECSECAGTGRVEMLLAGDVRPCPDCERVRAVIDQSEASHHGHWRVPERFAPGSARSAEHGR
jgi:hypothetical protein